MKSVLEKVGVYRSGTIVSKVIMLFAYADDLNIIGRTRRDVTAPITAIKCESTDMGLAVKDDKYVLSTSRAWDI